MTYLIDAYNLMHAVGYLTQATPANRLASSRRRLLDWLAGHARTRPGDRFHVVFDATSSASELPDETYKGLTASYAVGETADAVLIRLFTGAKTGTVAVVTNDSEIREAARRRGVETLLCSAFVDRMLAVPLSPAPVAPSPEKPESQDADADLLAAFSAPKSPRHVRRPRL